MNRKRSTFGTAKKHKYFDSILVYTYSLQYVGYKIYALHRYKGMKWGGEVIWKYRLMPIPEQPHFGFETVQEVYEHINNTFKGQKELFDQWAASFPNDGRNVSLQALTNAYVYQWGS